MTAFEKPRFPALSVEEAHLRHALLAALNGRRVGGALLRAHIPNTVRPEPVEGLPSSLDLQSNTPTHSVPTNTDWFRCAEDLAFRLHRLDGHPVRTDATDGSAMAMLLDAANPLLCEIEAALGLTLDPTDIGQRPLAATLIAHISLHDGPSPVAAMDLALSPDTPILPVPAPFAPALLGHIPLPARLLIDGPRLSPTDAAALAPGDLLLLGIAPLMAGVSLPGAPVVPGRILPAERLFRPIP
ncbi:hypothetical protein [Sphingobium sp. WCS2017Hpa-17]|uniref:hypothetical protein n=1 Tax=Sphingobium sp. WCS2017Hpa-17 TaxID=3073638 RepID=UPI00288BA063|nr:hypothetical protein [Sphingobium sp. WCS2017Hpa-17]